MNLMMFASLSWLWLVPAALPLGESAATSAEPQGDVVELTVGRSTHLVPGWPVAGASLTDPTVAGVDVVLPELILVRGLAAGTTDLVLWSQDGRTSELKIDVVSDLAPLTANLARMFPGAALTVEESAGVTLVRGNLQRADQAEQLRSYMEGIGANYVDQTTIPGVQQVQVKVRVAEVSRTMLRTLGINGFETGDDFFLGSTVGPANGGPINPFNIGPPGGSTATGDVPFTFNGDVGVGPAVSIFAGLPKADLQVFLEALVENQYLRILAEPNLVALSGEKATFLAGGEFPIPVVQGGGTTAGTSITIEYKEFGIGLEVRPIVLGEGRIRLQVASEVSDLTDIGSVELQGFQIPAVVTRKTQTAVEMRSGQSFALSGLISETTNAQVSKVPGLGSLPVLGSLFRSVRYRRGETELVVMVTATLVEPLSLVNLPPLPGTEHIEPSDWELYAEGALEGARPSKLSFSMARWMQEQQLDRLRGPGAWANHGEPVPTSRASRWDTPPPSPDAED